MGHYLHTTNRFPLARHHRFSYQFCDDFVRILFFPDILFLIIKLMKDSKKLTRRENPKEKKEEKNGNSVKETEKTNNRTGRQEREERKETHARTR